MPDPVGTALASIGAGATLGAAVMTVGALVLRSAQAAAHTAVSVDAGFILISVAVFLGIVAAVAFGWRLARPIDDQWRRGIVSALAVFGAFLLALVAALADMLAGRIGLSIYVFLLLGGAVLTRTAARRAGTT